MLKRTPLYELHAAADARLVDFGGWEMPLHYGSQMDEHHAVRDSCGLFDVSHMTVIDLSGVGARDFVRYLVANDVDKLKRHGQAQYTCMLNEKGGVIDDLIVYWRDDNQYRFVVNASTRDKDLAWIKQQAESFEVTVEEQDEMALIAVQGPNAADVFAKVAEHNNLHGLWEKVKELKPFSACEHNAVFVGRTGYTGEDGYEIILPGNYAVPTWRAFTSEGAVPCGLGCRDTLRIEAGMNLYGTDMDESTTPLESGIGWTVDLTDPQRHFVGRTALEAQQAAGHRVLTGILLKDRGVLRGGQEVVTAEGVKGVLTSGTFSPTIKGSVGFVRLEGKASGACTVFIRKRELAAELCTLPFVRNGTIKVDV